MISKIIWQTYSKPWEEVPDYIKLDIETWRQNNPDWQYYFYDENDRRNYIKENHPQWLEHYDKISIPFIRADFWRYLALYQYGGLYADLDTYCTEPLDNWVDFSSDMIATDSDHPEYGYAIETFAFLVAPQSKYMKAVIDKMIYRIENSLGHGDYAINTFHTGPYMVADAIEPIKDSTLKFTSFFDGKIIHKGGSHRWGDSQEQRRMPHTHFWQKRKNIDIKISNNGYGSGVAKKWE